MCGRVSLQVAETNSVAQVGISKLSVGTTKSFCIIKRLVKLAIANELLNPNG